MSGSANPPPTLAGFQAFITNVMQISTTYLPLTDPVIPMALGVALAIVNPDLALIASGPGAVAGVPYVNIYTLAVYNLAADNLLNWANDQPGQTYFANLRGGAAGFDINSFVPGVLNSTSDVSTSASFAVPEALTQLTMSQLQNVKTPYGRQYLAFAQMAGPGLWGIT